MQYFRTTGSAPILPLVELWYYTQCLAQTEQKRKGKTLSTISRMNSRYLIWSKRKMSESISGSPFSRKGCKSHGLLSIVWNKVWPGFRRDWICGHRSRRKNCICLQITQVFSQTQLILEFRSYNLEMVYTQLLMQNSMAIAFWQSQRYFEFTIWSQVGWRSGYSVLFLRFRFRVQTLLRL